MISFLIEMISEIQLSLNMCMVPFELQMITRDSSCFLVLFSLLFILSDLNVTIYTGRNIYAELCPLYSFYIGADL